MTIYITLSILGIYMFGSSISPDLMDSIGDKEDNWSSIVLSVAFLILIVCHIPFVFFYGKETFLMLIDEIKRRSISQTLDQYITRPDHCKRTLIMI
jgi:hypothetical protein